MTTAERLRVIELKNRTAMSSFPAKNAQEDILSMEAIMKREEAQRFQNYTFIKSAVAAPGYEKYLRLHAELGYTNDTVSGGEWANIPEIDRSKVIFDMEERLKETTMRKYEAQHGEIW